MFPFKKHAVQPAQTPLNEKLQEIRTQLTQLNDGAKKVGGEQATLSDDAPLPADKRAAIARDETLIRTALQTVGIDYDALIATPSQEGTPSPYALAVQANPALLQDVLGAPTPALKALEVAVNFKPYAEFSAKYGHEPAAIKAAIRAEVLAENPAAPEAPEAATPTLPFSRIRGGSKAAPAKPKGTLNEVFRS